MNTININNLTKNYGNEKGIFDISIQVKKGEVYGYLGPNGAGKSTTMRILMGFTKPQKGSVTIYNMDCWKKQKEIQKRLGYLPGEISFPDDMTGTNYLRLIAKMRSMKDFTYTKNLLEMFEINPNTSIKQMSKGMKQKIGIVASFMHDPDVLLLDEPTSGLDPLMQNRFIELIKEEKNKGKTIILSSHIFEEVEKTCDRVGMIRSGKLIKEVSIDELQHSQLKTYKIEFKNIENIEYMQKKYPNGVYTLNQHQMIISIYDSQINNLISDLSKCNIHALKEEKHTLEDYFMQFYRGEKNV